MIWVSLLILLGVVGLFWLVDWHLTAIRAQISIVGQLLAAPHDDLGKVRALLGEIAGHTKRLPEPPQKPLPEYPGDPRGRYFSEE